MAGSILRTVIRQSLVGNYSSGDSCPSAGPGQLNSECLRYRPPQTMARRFLPSPCVTEPRELLMCGKCRKVTNSARRAIQDSQIHADLQDLFNRGLGTDPKPRVVARIAARPARWFYPFLNSVSAGRNAAETLLRADRSYSADH